MAVGRKLKELQFRLRLRKVITNASYEELEILKEELNKEREKRRNKK